MADDLDALLDEQSAYYRARAPEYDQWWRREGSFDRGEAFNRAWHTEVGQLQRFVDQHVQGGHVLELAAGTGWWTEHLASRAGRITAVDQSPEALAINRERVAGAPGPVEHVEADLFDWRPPERYDVVFFSFWLTHVPPSRFDTFWDLVAGALAPGGTAVVVDNAEPLEPPEAPGVSVRQLNDGREYRIVKLYWTVEELRARLEPRGWRLEGGRTDRFFTFAAAALTA